MIINKNNKQYKGVMAKFWSIVFLAHFFPQSGHAACTQNQNRINATAGSKCIPIYPAYTTMGTSVFNAQGAGSTITANAAVKLTNTLNGANGRGATATNGGSIIFNELVTITTGLATGNSDGSTAVYATTGGTVLINNGANIITQGNNSISTPDLRNNGLSVELSGNGALIETRGTVNIEVNGLDTRGINVAGNVDNQILLHDNVTVRVLGTSARGLHANDGASIVSDGLLTISHEGISSVGNLSAAIYATATNTGGGRIILNNLNATTFQSGVYGVATNSMSGNIGTVDINGNALINVLGNNSAALLALNGSAIKINYGQLNALGMGSSGIIAQGNNSQISLNGGTVNAERHAVFMDSGTGQLININNTSLASINGSVLAADNATSSSLSFVNSNATAMGSQLLLNVTGLSELDVISRNSILNGNINASSASLLNVQLIDGSILTGAIDSAQLNIDQNSVWNMSSNSNLLSLNNNGIIDLRPFNALYKNLMVNGNYSSSTGQLHINTFLGADASASDLLIINGGAATGNTKLFAHNTTGMGALTLGNGILVVDAINGATTTADAFTLGNRVVAGPYEYSLFRSSVDDSGSDNWYLRSVLDCSLDMNNPVCAKNELSHYRQEVSLYSTLPSMAALYGRTLIDTLDERLGTQQVLSSTQIESMKPSAFWGRIIGKHGLNYGDNLGIYSSRGARFDYDIGGFQAGADLYRNEGKDYSGLYGAIGQIDGTVSHFNHLEAGKNKLNTFSAGGYWTHYTATQWYIDSVVQGSWYNIKATSNKLMQLTTDGFGLAASVESGYPVHIAHSWSIEPQAQLIYQFVGLDDAGDAASSIGFKNTDFVSGRVGARLAKNMIIHTKSFSSEVTAWIRPGLWREFQGSATTTFSSEISQIPFTSNLRGSWAEFTGGLTAKLKEDTRLYLSAGYDKGLASNNKNYAYNGKLGLKTVW